MIAVKTANTKQNKTLATRTVAKTIVSKMTKRAHKRVPAPTKRAMDVFGKPSNTDVNGSYTGLPKNIHEEPIQDADDL